MKLSQQKFVASLGIHTILIGFSAIFFLPFYLVIINVFKPKEYIFTMPLGIPFDELTLDNLVRNLNSPYFSVITAYSTSIVISASTVILVVLTASMLSYVLSRNRSGFWKFSYLLLLLGLTLPSQVILLPIIQVLRVLRLMFTIPGLLLLNIGWYMPFATFVFVGYIGTISPQLDESATIEGANDLQTFFYIIFPLMKPALATVMIYITIWTWNDFIGPLIILGSSKYYTITIGIYKAIGQYTQKWEDVFAIIFIAILPIIIFYLFMQRFFISGLTQGAVKQ